MFILIVAFLKECFYEDVSLQMDTIFYNTSFVYLKYVSLMLKLLKKPRGKNMSVLL
jgi:hypothetical protein